MAAFRAELKKAHRRHDLAFCLLLPLILVLWVGGLAPASEDELSNAYSALFYSIPVLEAILLPVMMAVLASRLWDLEVKGNTLKLLYTLQSRRSLFAGKAVFGVLEVLVTVAVELACIPVLGTVHGYTEAFGAASCAVSRMKAHWFYLIHRFEGADPLEKPLRKAREGWEYETVVNQIFTRQLK